jgi:hypothetical protein
VFRDLHPYCCTHEHCTIADRLYDSRKAWFAHELETHRTAWQCVEECGKTFQEEADFETHVQKSHPDLASASMLSALKRTSAKSADLTGQTQCVLCGKSMMLRAMQRHLGSHQQQLALFALPANLDDTEDEPNDDDGESITAGNVNDEELSDLSDESDTEEVDDIAEPDIRDSDRDEDMHTVQSLPPTNAAQWRNMPPAYQMPLIARLGQTRPPMPPYMATHAMEGPRSELGDKSHAMLSESVSGVEHEVAIELEKARLSSSPSSSARRRELEKGAQILKLTMSLEDRERGLRREEGKSPDRDSKELEEQVASAEAESLDNPTQNREELDTKVEIITPDEEMHGKAVVLFDFARENDNELPLVEGQIVLVSYRHGQGWLVAQDLKTGKSGLVPEEYVRLLRYIEGGLGPGGRKYARPRRTTRWSSCCSSSRPRNGISWPGKSRSTSRGPPATWHC